MKKANCFKKKEGRITMIKNESKFETCFVENIKYVFEYQSYL